MNNHHRISIPPPPKKDVPILIDERLHEVEREGLAAITKGRMTDAPSPCPSLYANARSLHMPPLAMINWISAHLAPLIESG